MNGKDVPYVDMPDLEIAPNGGGSFSNASCLYFDSVDGEVDLSAVHIENVDSVFGSGSFRQ